MDNITVKQLYQIFFGKELANVSEYQPSTPVKSKPQSDPHPWTPVSKAIYQATSPKSRPRILQEMQANTKTVEKIEAKEEVTDPDYQEKLENNGLGLFMEDYLAAHGFCPVCGQKTLRKYMHSNVPVVDLVCVNTTYHLANNKCFLFQVKISLTNEYFSLTNHTIIVGSRNYGQPAHIRRGDVSLLDKLVIPGYICLKLNLKAGEIQTYIIDHRNSFVLIPDYQNYTNHTYYQYIDVENRYRKNVLTWDPSMVATVSLDRVLKDNVIQYQVFAEKAEANPYSFLIK